MTSIEDEARAEIVERLGSEVQQHDGERRITAFIAGAEWQASRSPHELKGWNAGYQEGYIAGALWQASRQPREAEVQRVREAVFAQSQFDRRDSGGESYLYYPSIRAAEVIARTARGEQHD